MRINISNELFETDHLDLERINYIFGKNGTGKSTLTRMINAQCASAYDVRIFQGFQSIIGSDNRLGAVVLGEQNAAIAEQIDRIREHIKTLESAKSDMETEITLPDVTGMGNLATKLTLAEKKKTDAHKNLEKFYSSAAKHIKEISNPAIAVPSYNKRTFGTDIENAVLISETERQQYTSTLLSEVKTAPAISFPDFNIDQLIDDTNELLEAKVEEKMLVARLENSPEKQMFAQEGFHLHKPGDVCAFCGNVISNTVFEELGSYFSADETKALQSEISNYIEKFKVYKEQVQSIRITSTDFYPDYLNEVTELSNRYANSVILYMDIFDQLTAALLNKLGHLFESLNPVNIEERPYKISDFRIAYDVLRNKNNEADLSKKQKAAKDALRLDAVKRELDNRNYESLLSAAEESDREYSIANQAVAYKKKEIQEILDEINEYLRKINSLLAQTKNEQKLALNINKKLHSYVSFELEHYEDFDHKGYYRIKNPKTGISRPVTQLSTGEKNIIAFLYFLEKLEEIDEDSQNVPKMIVFDDPMNSNDASMRYLITNELSQLIRRIEIRNRDTIVVLTHNIDCYLQLCRFNSDNDYLTHNVIHFLKTNYKTSINKITSRRDDFTTSYGVLWRELIHMYKDDEADADTMLNMMRRIIETYTKFNGRNWNKFCEAAGVPLTLFHSGSHAVTNLGSQPNVYSKQELVTLFYKCFDANHCANHLKFYWPGIEKIVTV